MRYFLLFLVLVFGMTVPVGAVVNPVAVNPDQPTKEEVMEKIHEYQAELKAMSRKERRALKKEQRKEARTAIRTAKADGDVDFALLVVLAIILPPLAVYLHEGEIATRFWISLLLTLLFFLPGIIYALIIVLE